jgi:ferredoxin-thioredoxin reductase catalytic chain
MTSGETVERMYERLDREARESGYHLNPDSEFTRELIEGLVVNTQRYGYPSCPCRLASTDKAEDLDIICPCDYRDPDLGEYGCCYCALYVSEEVVSGKAEAESIPERRLPAGRRDEEDEAPGSAVSPVEALSLRFPVWRCSVCGYLCAREQPPEICPICRVTKDRFRLFM